MNLWPAFSTVVFPIGEYDLIVLKTQVHALTDSAQRTPAANFRTPTTHMCPHPPAHTHAHPFARPHARMHADTVITTTLESVAATIEIVLCCDTEQQISAKEDILLSMRLVNEILAAQSAKASLVEASEMQQHPQQLGMLHQQGMPKQQDMQYQQILTQGYQMPMQQSYGYSADAQYMPQQTSGM